jgi:lysozyme family protein
MAASNAARCIANTLVYEGGFTLHKGDPGNWTGGKVGAGQLKGTNFGIAANTYPDLDIRNLTKDDAIVIYRRDFWPKVAGDAMPKGVDQLAYDGGVNSGPSRGLRWIAEACGIPNERRASVIAAAATSSADRPALIKRASGRRMTFLRGLGSFATFGTGWTRRVAAMEAIGVKMALEAAGTVLHPTLTKESEQASSQSKKSATASVGTAGADAAAHRTLEPAAMDGVLAVLTWVGIIGAIAAILFFAYWALMHNERAKAYADAANGRIGG